MAIKKPRSKVKLKIDSIEGVGVDIQRVLTGLSNLKSELEELGCKVSIKVEGTELEAGNGTRTRDILLGKKSVIGEGNDLAIGEVESA